MTCGVPGAARWPPRGPPSSGGSGSTQLLQGRLGRGRRQAARARRDRPPRRAARPAVGIRKPEYFLSVTDPRLIRLETDVLRAHVAQYTFRTRTAHDGSTRTDVFDPAALVTRHGKRYPLFHTKDRVVNTTSGMGYDMVPFGTGVIDYRSSFLAAGTGGGPCRAVTRPSVPAGPMSGHPLSGPWPQPYTADPQYFGGS